MMQPNIETSAASGGGVGDAAPFGDLPEDAFVTVNQVKPLYGNPVDSTLWRWIRAGDFPPPVRRTGPNKKGPRYWRVGTIRADLRGEWRPEQEATA